MHIALQSCSQSLVCAVVTQKQKVTLFKPGTQGPCHNQFKSRLRSDGSQCSGTTFVVTAERMAAQSSNLVERYIEDLKR